MTRSRVITTSTADAGGHDLLHGTDGPPAAADRAAIEALARELDDDDWPVVFAVATQTNGYAELPSGKLLNLETCQALLACLDEVWAGLDGNGQRYLVMLGCDGPWEDTCAFCGWQECAAVELAMRTGGVACHTPLGRAVLRRAKEQGHA